MECYSLKSCNSSDYMMIVRDMNEGYVVRIVRDKDGYEETITDFISKDLFDSCIRTGYLKPIVIENKQAVNA